jgi:branched-chain amino acid transport system ATP-binding protein
MGEPKLLMLDEPSFGLAPLVIDRILDVAVTLCRSGLAVLLVEQLVEKALAHAETAILMDTGRVVHVGRAAEIAGSELLARTFIGAKPAIKETVK